MDDVSVDRLRRTISGGAVDLVVSSDRSIGSVARELGLRDWVLRWWVDKRGVGLEPTAAPRRT